MNRMKSMAGVRLGLILTILTSTLACGGGTDESTLVINRVRFLQQRNKHDEALKFALESADKLRGKERGEVLLLTAEMTHLRFMESGREAYATQTLQLLQSVINEKLILDGRPHYQVAMVFEVDKQYDKAIKYLQMAEKYAAPLPNEAGNYACYIITILKKMGADDEVVTAAEAFFKKYPDHARTGDVERLQSEAQLSRDQKTAQRLSAE